MLDGAAQFGFQQRECGLPVLGITLRLDAVHADEFEVLIAVAFSAHERRAFSLRELRQALIDHHVSKITDRLFPACGRIVGLVFSRAGDFDGKGERLSLHLRVEFGDDAIAGSHLAKIGFFSVAMFGFGVGKLLFDLRFDGGGVFEIAHGHDHSTLGGVILLVEVHEARTLHRLDHLFRADGHAVR